MGDGTAEKWVGLSENTWVDATAVEKVAAMAIAMACDLGPMLAVLMVDKMVGSWAVEMVAVKECEKAGMMV